MDKRIPVAESLRAWRTLHMRAARAARRHGWGYVPPSPEQAHAWWDTVLMALDGEENAPLNEVLGPHAANAEQMERLLPGLRLGGTVGSAQRALRPLLIGLRRVAERAPCASCLGTGCAKRSIEIPPWTRCGT